MICFAMFKGDLILVAFIYTNIRMANSKFKCGIIYFFTYRMPSLSRNFILNIAKNERILFREILRQLSIMSDHTITFLSVICV